MGRPELIVLDEPTNGLDPAGMADMRALSWTLARGGQTVLLSSHLLAEVQEICDRVGVINRGRLLREWTVAELRGGTHAARARRTPGPGARRRAARRRRRRASGWRATDVVVDLGADAPGLVRALVADGVDVHEVTTAERTLEEVFFEMTARRAGGSVMSTFTSNPVLRSTRAELLRLRRWPAVWVTLGAWLALAAMFGYLFNYLAYATGSQNFATDGQPTGIAARAGAARQRAGGAGAGHADVRRRADDGARRAGRRQRVRLGHLEDGVHPGPVADLGGARLDGRAWPCSCWGWWWRAR